jgi:hypothetical protein
MIFIIHSQEVWSLFPLLQDGLPGRVLHHDRQTLLRPGNYIVLRDSGKCVACLDTEASNFD